MDNAFEKARQAYGTGAYDDATLEFLFPQLKESEDERVRKFLVKHVSEWIGCIEHDLKISSKDIESEEELAMFKASLAYLEKQKDQKSLNISAASEWLRKHVCNYINSEYNEFHHCVEYDGSIDKERLINDFEEAMQKEQKPLSTEETELNSIAFLEQMGYTCIPPGKEQKPAEREWPNLSNCIRNCKKCHGKCLYRKEPYEEKHPAEWSEFDRGALKDAICAADILGNDESFNKGNPYLAKAFRVAKDWLKSLPERFNPQPKQEWSEEDEKILNELLDHCNTENATWYNWLKHLRPQSQATYKQIIHSIYEMLKDKDFYAITPEHRMSLLNDIRVKCRHADEWAEILDEFHWKPSNEQMEALEKTIRLANFGAEENRRKALISLHTALKKLI